MYPEAAEQFQIFSDLTSGSTLALASLANVRARSGDQAAAERLLARLHIVATQKHVPAYQFAIVYSGLGDVDAAMKWLEVAYEERSDFLLYLRNETLFDGLRADPRFVDLERRIGI